MLDRLEIVLDDIADLQKAPPGPPPRPGLTWKESTHRWIRSKRPGKGEIPAGRVVSKIDWVEPAIDAKGARFSLAGQKIPPAWTNVWVNSDPSGDLQVIGKDKSGQTQRIPSDEFVRRRAEAKFAKLRQFTAQLAELRERVAQDFDSSEEAKVVALIDQTGFRVGNRRSPNFGASTIQGRHVRVRGDTLTFKFRGKSNVDNVKTIRHPELAKLVGDRKRERGSGAPLFDTDDDRVRKYFKRAGFSNITPKDYRTYYGTKLAIEQLEKEAEPKTEREFKKLKKVVADVVSNYLGNTPPVALGSYIDPKVFYPYEKALGLLKAGLLWEPEYDLILEDYSYVVDGWDGKLLTEEVED